MELPQSQVVKTDNIEQLFDWSLPNSKLVNYKNTTTMVAKILNLQVIFNSMEQHNIHDIKMLM